MKQILNHLFENKTFSRAEAQRILTSIALGEFNTSQIAAFITAYGMRNITVEELQGFRDAMLDLCQKIDLSDFELVDLCGTGGDGKDTFNISTLASFVVAGAGHKVAKHGNYGVSSGCGSSNVMEYLGYSFTNDETKLTIHFNIIPHKGICFGSQIPLFTYYENEHENLLGKVYKLEQLGFVINVTDSNYPKYKMTHEFIKFLTK